MCYFRYTLYDFQVNAVQITYSISITTVANKALRDDFIIFVEFQRLVSGDVTFDAPHGDADNPLGNGFGAVENSSQSCQLFIWLLCEDEICYTRIRLKIHCVNSREDINKNFLDFNHNDLELRSVHVNANYNLGKILPLFYLKKKTTCSNFFSKL